MPPSEQPPQSTDRRTSTRKQNPLYLRMYFQTWMTELVQLIGYRDVPIDEAREKLKPLIDRHGKQRMMEACEELVEVDASKKPTVARLKAEVSKLAFQILGPRPVVVPAAPEAAVTSPENASTPVKLPRYHVMGKYEEYLGATKLRFSTAADLRDGMPFLEMLPALDYIVERERMRLLVTVRPSFRGNQAAQMIAYSDALLANHAAVRVWPVSGVSGWEWQEHELFAEPLGIDPTRFKLTLDDWRAVHEHYDGDKKCNRDWLTEGCACACCRAARAILTAKPAKSRTRN